MIKKDSRIIDRFATHESKNFDSCKAQLGLVANQKILIRDSWINLKIDSSYQWFANFSWFANQSWIESFQKKIQINFPSPFLQKIATRFESRIIDSDPRQALSLTVDDNFPELPFIEYPIDAKVLSIIEILHLPICQKPKADAHLRKDEYSPVLKNPI